MSALDANKASLTQGPIGQTLIKMLLGMLVGHLAMTVFNLTDTYFVAQLGTEELAAISFTFPMIFTIMSVIFGLGIGTSSLISQAIGKQNQHHVQRLTTDLLILGVLVAIVLSSLGLIFSRPIFYAMGARGEVLELTLTYMRIWFWGMPLVTIPMMGNNAMRGTGDTTTPGLVMATGAIANLVLDPLMIFGLAGFPRMGIAGAAIATLVGRGCALVLSLSVLILRKKMISLDRPVFKDVMASWRKIAYIGIPAGMTQALSPLTAVIITRMVASYGTVAVAAFGAGAKIDMITLMVLISLGSVLMPFVGQNWGAGKMDRVKAAHRWSYIFAIVWGVVMYVVVVTFSRPIAHAFSEDPLVVEKIRQYLIITSLSLGLVGLWRIVAMSMNGLHQPLHAAALNITALLLLTLPCTVLGSYFYGLIGLFAGMAVGKMLSGVAAFIWATFLHRCAQRHVDIEPVEPERIPDVEVQLEA